MHGLLSSTLLFAMVLPADGPVKKKQMRTALRQLRACAGSASPNPGGPALSGGSQYAELMRMELRGLERKRWRPERGGRTFKVEKKGSFGQRYRFELTIAAEQISLMRILHGGRGDRSAYGAVWKGSRLFVYPLTERCEGGRCAWARTQALEMTCAAAAIPAKSNRASPNAEERSLEPPTR